MPAEAPAVMVWPRKLNAKPVDRLLQQRRLGAGVGLAEIPQQQRELVAAEPADHIGGAHMAEQFADDGFQHLIARRMSIACR